MMIKARPFYVENSQLNQTRTAIKQPLQCYATHSINWLQEGLHDPIRLQERKELAPTMTHENNQLPPKEFINEKALISRLS